MKSRRNVYFSFFLHFILFSTRRPTKALRRHRLACLMSCERGFRSLLFSNKAVDSGFSFQLSLGLYTCWRTKVVWAELQEN